MDKNHNYVTIKVTGIIIGGMYFEGDNRELLFLNDHKW